MAEQSQAPEVGDDQPDGTPGDDGAGEPRVDDARVVGLESADADEVIGAVSSETGRSVLAALQEEPAPASGLAERLDCSLQTVQYHLDNLANADLVERVGTTTSEKGREMDVYGPTGRPVVVYAGDDEDAADLRSVLKRLVSGVAFLGLVSLLVQELLAGEPAAETTGADVSVEYTQRAADGGAAAGPEPGVVFFAGGLVVLAGYLAWWYLRRTGRLEGVLPWE